MGGAPHVPVYNKQIERYYTQWKRTKGSVLAFEPAEMEKSKANATSEVAHWLFSPCHGPVRFRDALSYYMRRRPAGRAIKL